MRHPSRTGGARPLVETLAAAAPRVGPSDRQEKLRCLEALAGLRVGRARLLSRLHEALCFLQAFPDDPGVLAAVERALEAVPGRVAALPPAERARLAGSGIAGTTLEYPFGLPMARWLARRFPQDVDIAWEALAEPEHLQETLPLLVHRLEEDAVSDEGGLGWRRWLAVARAGRRLSDLQVLVALFDRAPLRAGVRDGLFESLGLDLRWTHRGPGASRTAAKLPWPRSFFHATGTPPASPRDTRQFLAEVRRPLPALRRAPRPLALALVEAARASVGSRSRELFAFTHANPDDILLAEPGWGLRIALFGLLPAHRLAYDGYYAYLALRNGVPVGYGGGWQCFGTVEVGVNVFETFRGGDSGLLVSQVLRAYHRALRPRAILVDPYQIGHDNPEALRSGAFYFYYRRGFRPRDPEVRRLALAEQETIARDPRYRSPLPVLRRLARSEVFLSLDGASEPDWALRPARLAALVTEHVARRFGGDRRRAAREAAERVGRALGARRRRDWPREERAAFERLALLADLVPDLERWPAADRRRLLEAMRAKGGPSEARYVRLLDGHRRLRHSLRALAARPDAAR